MYRQFVRPLLFRFDPEWVHHASLTALTKTPAAAFLAPFARREFPSLRRELFGLTFPNPIGLAAGFDKNAEGVLRWPQLGFGFMELGTFTPRPQPGNPKPRIFRLPAEQGLINRLGFPNVGVEKVAERLEAIKSAGQWPKTPVGLNLGKNKDTALTDAGLDYVACFKRLRDLGDYFVVNVSSPNTPGLRDLQQGALLDSILAPMRDEDPSCARPLLIKIAPDLDPPHLGAIVAAVEKYKLAGIVATNTTINKAGALGAGGRWRERTSPHHAEHGNHSRAARDDAGSDHRRGWNFQRGRRTREIRGGRGFAAGLHRICLRRAVGGAANLRGTAKRFQFLGRHCSVPKSRFGNNSPMRRFFRVVWRINAILICLASLLLLFALSYAVISSLPTSRGNADNATVKPSGDKPDDKIELSIAEAEPLPGTKVVRLEVSRGAHGQKLSSFSRGEPWGACNYIFYDAGSNGTTTLFPSNSNFIATCNDLCFPETPYNERVLKWSAFTFADKDTSGDGVVNAEDQLSVGVASPTGEGFHVYLTGLDRVLTMRLEGENDLFVYYVQGKSVYVARIDLAAQKILIKKTIF